MHEHHEYIPSKKRAEGIGLIFGNFLFDEKGKLLSTIVGRGKITKKPDYKDGDFFDKEDKVYPHVHLLWYEKYQLLLLEVNGNFYSNYETIFKSIELHFNNLLNRYGLTVYIEPWTEITNFWKVIEEYDNIYYVAFELHMPNFFGRTQDEIKEMLMVYKDQHNATSYTSKLSNAEGRLNISRDDRDVNSSLEWISKGAGNWTTSVSKKNKKRVVLKSKKDEYMKTIDTTVEIENYTVEEITELISKLNIDSLMDDKINGNQKS